MSPRFSAKLNDSQLARRIADVIERGEDPTKFYYSLPWKDKTVGNVIEAATRENEILKVLLRNDILKSLSKHTPPRALSLLAVVVARILDARGYDDREQAVADFADHLRHEIGLGPSYGKATHK